jgi:hypothetical protein
MGLECVNESLPEIKIELVFANKVLGMCVFMCVYVCMCV